MDLDIKREALNHAVAIGLAEINSGGPLTGVQVVAFAEAFEAYLTGGDAK